MVTQSMNETITNATAGAAVTAHWWSISSLSSELFTGLGVLWLGVQITSTIYKTWIKK